MLKRPSIVTIASVATLSLATVAVATVFSIVDAAMLRPFPYQDPQDIVWIDHTLPAQNLEALPVSYPNARDWRERSRLLRHMAVFQYASFRMAGEVGGIRVAGLRTDPELFQLLGIEPRFGRVLRPDDLHAAVISFGLWQRSFGGDPLIIGRPLVLDGLTHTITGVMPPGFQFPELADIWTPLSPDAPRLSRSERGFRVVARLSPGARLAEAAAEMRDVQSQLRLEHPAASGELDVRVIPLRDYYIDDERLPLLLALGAVLLLLAIACCNVGGLLVARAAALRKETAMRAALGASRWRIAREALAYGAGIAAAAAILGAPLASLAQHWIVSSIPMRLPVWLEFRLDTRVLVFTILLCALSALLFSIAPVMHAWKTDLMDALRIAGSGSTSIRSSRGRKALVATEVGLALVVLILASLLVRTFSALRGEQTGFDSAGVLAALVELPPVSSGDTFLQQALPQIRSLPRVTAAGAVSSLPLRRGAPVRKVTIEGQVALADSAVPIVSARAATPGYFETLKIPLREGRVFRDGDDSGAQLVAVVSQSAARRFWNGRSPVGARLKMAAPAEPAPWLTVVGVVGDVRQSWFGPDMSTAVYVPLAQSPTLSFAVVARGGSHSAAALRQILSSANREAAVDVTSMKQVVDESFWRNRLYALLFGWFAITALSLAVGGVLSLVLYSVTVSRRDLAIRAALGAASDDLVLAAAAQGLRPAVVGALLGLAVTPPVARLLRGAMYGVATYDPLAWGTATFLLLGFAALACTWPCWQVSRISPAEALRDGGGDRPIARY